MRAIWAVMMSLDIGNGWVEKIIIRHQSVCLDLAKMFHVDSSISLNTYIFVRIRKKVEKSGKHNIFRVLLKMFDDHMNGNPKQVFSLFKVSRRLDG